MKYQHKCSSNNLKEKCGMSYPKPLLTFFLFWEITSKMVTIAMENNNSTFNKSIYKLNEKSTNIIITKNFEENVLSCQEPKKYSGKYLDAYSG